MDDPPSSYAALRDILGDVNQWLHFAEAKNAVLVTFDLALVVGIGTIGATGTNLPESFGTLSVVFCLGLTISALTSLSSFFPNLLKFLDPKTCGGFEGNIFYFGDLAAASGHSFLVAFHKKATGTKQTAFDDDLANQIVTNSRITLRKLRAFAIALRITGAFILFAMVALIIEICR
jgi:hypothetical protein